MAGCTELVCYFVGLLYIF